MAHIFISYSKKDIDFARHLRHLLQDQGFAVWMDETRLVPSEKWWPTIERNIISCAAFIVIMSPNGKDSEWIEREILVAEDEDHRKPIFPVLLEGKRWGRLANIQYQDMTQGAEASLNIDFVEGLRQYLPADGGQAPPPLPDPVIGTESVPLATPSRRIVWVIAAVIVLIIGSASAFILSQGSANNPTPTTGAPTDDVTATIAAGVAATETKQALVAIVVTSTPSFTSTIVPSPTLTFTTRPSDTPFNVGDAIAATIAGDATETANAIASFTRTPTVTFTASVTLTDTPDINGTVAKGVEQTRAANAIASYTKTSTATFTPSKTATATNTPTLTLTFTPSHTPTITLTPTRDPSIKVTSNDEWKPFIQVAIFNDVEMVLVPAGCFVMGSTDAQRQEAIEQYVKEGTKRADAETHTANEQPSHRVCFDKPFWIDSYEVTNKQYGRAGGFKGNNQPRETISWIDASAFCKLREARLPTEAEWEYAARGPDGLIYPWGNEFIADNVVYSGNSGNQPADVGSRADGVSWVGAYDLGGNVWEWVADWYDAYSADDKTNPQGTRQGNTRSLRGGSWYNIASNARVTDRDSRVPNLAFNNLGFRCARDY